MQTQKKQAQGEPIIEATLPPHSADAERAVLGSIMLDNTTLPIARGILSASDFYAKAHGIIFDAMITLETNGVPIDPTTLSETLGDNLQTCGGPIYVMWLEAYVMATANIAAHAKIVKEHSRRRQTWERLRTASDRARDGGDDVDLVLSDTSAFILDMQGRNGNGTAQHIGHAIGALERWIEETRKAGVDLTGLSTGFPALDDLTNGLQKGDMIILAARPSIGKTACALSITSHAILRDRAPVLFFSLEMSRMQLAQRLTSMISGVDLSAIRRPRGLHEGHMKAIDSASQAIRRAPLMIDDTAGIDIALLRARARQYRQQRSDLALIVIDYLQLVTNKATRRGDNRQVQVSEISGLVKQIARECETPVLCLSQLSREIERRGKRARPQLSDLRESGSIEQDADVVMFLHRQSEDDSAGAGYCVPVALIVDKARNGPTGEIALDFQARVTRFDAMERE